MSSSIKSYLKWDCAAGVYQSEAPSPPRYCHGVVEQYCRFLIWSDGECKTLAENGLQQDSTPPTPLSHTLFVYRYMYCTLTQGQGEEVTRKVGRGAREESSDHKARSKIPT
jgi:hypothetical protein